MTSSRVFADSNLDPRFRAGLVGHWIGGGSGLTWFDRSGNGNHAAITGASWALGHRDMDALSFDGNDSADFGVGASLNAPSALTVCLWWRRTGAPSGAYHPLVQRLNASVQGYQLYVLANDTWGFYTNSAVSAPAIPDGWHHIAATNDGTTGRLFLDGVSVASGAQALENVASPTATAFGIFGANYANGQMEDVRIYNRALSAAEIATLANPAYSPIIGGGLVCGL